MNKHQLSSSKRRTRLAKGYSTVFMLPRGRVAKLDAFPHEP